MLEGIVVYMRENGETIKYHFHGMLEDETIEEYMIRNNIKFREIIDCSISGKEDKI